MKNTLLTLAATFAFAGLVHAEAACCATRAAKASPENKASEAKIELAAAPAKASTAVVAIVAQAEKPVQVASADKAEKATCSVAEASCKAGKECADKSTDKKDCDGKEKCDTKTECKG